MKQHRDILLALGWVSNSILEGAARYAGEHNWHLDISYTMDIANGWQGDGIITQHSSVFANKEYRDKIENLPQPRVLINRDICGDYTAAGRMAADYFLEKGYSSFCVFGPESTERAFTARVEECGYQTKLYDYLAIRDQTSWEQKRKDLSAILRSLSKPAAVYICDDRMAADIIQTALSIGLSIPGDIAVLGKDNNAMLCNALAVPLSSVDVNLTALGYQAAKMLDNLLDGKPLPDEPVLIEPRCVVERQSTSTSSITSLAAARAIRFMNDNHDQDITIKAIAANAGCSIRNLYRIFENNPGHTIGEELFRIRLHHAEKLLLNSSEKQFNIAFQSGFGTVQNLHKAFMKAHGIAPGKWKQRRVFGV